jgi:hypothetical protein
MIVTRKTRIIALVSATLLLVSLAVAAVAGPTIGDQDRDQVRDRDRIAQQTEQVQPGDPDGAVLQERERQQERAWLQIHDPEEGVTPLQEREREQERAQLQIHDPEEGVIPLQEREREQERAEWCLEGTEGQETSLQEREREQAQLQVEAEDPAPPLRMKERNGDAG